MIRISMQCADRPPGRREGREPQHVASRREALSHQRGRTEAGELFWRRPSFHSPAYGVPVAVLDQRVPTPSGRGRAAGAAGSAPAGRGRGRGRRRGRAGRRLRRAVRCRRPMSRPIRPPTWTSRRGADELGCCTGGCTAQTSATRCPAREGVRRRLRHHRTGRHNAAVAHRTRRLLSPSSTPATGPLRGHAGAQSHQVALRFRALRGAGRPARRRRPQGARS